ncbi:PREDICTED: ankyrin repeat and ELMO domain-containing protein D-like [Ceratosolen solmsi marchali]|uniref:Ankyrin repeat and ELMO domain-containing protein D-like n=1 Tax=Ceratosolen solmsi marchali TaxID=326594 RepID=A0AAJ7DUU4_9HYME|nr:PREDICTED: ankyrin repeat and ELMO domain-containing protein D-like [Ceratosolen solmsi marchali]
MLLFSFILVFIWILNLVEPKQYDIKGLIEKYLDDNNYPISNLEEESFPAMQQVMIYPDSYPIKIIILSPVKFSQQPCSNLNFKTGQIGRRTLIKPQTQKEIMRKTSDKTLMQFFEKAGLSLPALPLIPPTSPLRKKRKLKMNKKKSKNRYENKNIEHDNDNDDTNDKSNDKYTEDNTQTFRKESQAGLLSDNINSDEDESTSSYESNNENYNYNFNVLSPRRNRNIKVQRKKLNKPYDLHSSLSF